jgi:hypothetical protein
VRVVELVVLVVCPESVVVIETAVVREVATDVDELDDSEVGGGTMVETVFVFVVRMPETERATRSMIITVIVLP